jgi:hypothetical protein
VVRPNIPPALPVTPPDTKNGRSIADSSSYGQTKSPALSRVWRVFAGANMLDDANNSFGNTATAVSANSAPERNKRCALRCQLVAPVEVTERGSETKISARISEIGLGGCYVDTHSPFPNGTLVNIRIIRDGGAFECEAKVVYVHDRFGMGVAFTNIALDQRRLLQNWIAGLVTHLK